MLTLFNSVGGEGREQIPPHHHVYAYTCLCMRMQMLIFSSSIFLILSVEEGTIVLRGGSFPIHKFMLQTLDL